MDRMDSFGIVFRKTREARNKLLQRTLTHGNTEWKNVKVNNGLNNSATPPKAYAQRCLPNLAASIATRIALPQITNCKGIA
jgi:hypothetical protein